MCLLAAISAGDAEIYFRQIKQPAHKKPTAMECRGSRIVIRYDAGIGNQVFRSPAPSASR